MAKSFVSEKIGIMQFVKKMNKTNSDRFDLQQMLSLGLKVDYLIKKDQIGSNITKRQFKRILKRNQTHDLVDQKRSLEGDKIFEDFDQ